MEIVQNNNVHYIDEYPELKKRVWLRRLAQERAGKLVSLNLMVFPDRDTVEEQSNASTDE